MVDVQTPATTEGRVVRWWLGDGAKDWAKLTVDLGILTAEVRMSSREAREFAIAVLTDQGPYLGYQPPNERMRERPSAGVFGTERRGKPGWRKRESVEFCTDRLREVLDQFGEAAFGWALQRLGGEGSDVE